MNTIINNSASPLADSTTNDHIRRMLVVASAALFPIITSVLLTGLFYLLGDYRVIERVAAQTEFAAISYPQEGITVDEVFTARGVVTALPENTVAYLMVEREQRYWPKKYLGDTHSSWAKEISEAKRENSRLRLVVLAMSDAGKQVIEQWYVTSKQTGKYPGITDIPGAEEIAQVEVKQR
ncbi:MAG: hypothetical protein R3F02_10055 [Thiolinea sp.]